MSQSNKKPRTGQDSVNALVNTDPIEQTEMTFPLANPFLTMEPLTSTSELAKLFFNQGVLSTETLTAVCTSCIVPRLQEALQVLKGFKISCMRCKQLLLQVYGGTLGGTLNELPCRPQVAHMLYFLRELLDAQVSVSELL
jgi:hypothetical protein